MKYAIEFDTPLARIGIAEESDTITDLYYLHTYRPEVQIVPETPLLSAARRQLEEYLSGQRHTFDLPLAPRGTPFQLAVWQALTSIPYGETCSYAHIACLIGRPRACRAVGGANHRNPISIFLPCHRVVGADGSLTGYGGGLDIKKRLLTLEQTQKGVSHALG